MCGAHLSQLVCRLSVDLTSHFSEVLPFAPLFGKKKWKSNIETQNFIFEIILIGKQKNQQVNLRVGEFIAPALKRPVF